MMKKETVSNLSRSTGIEKIALLSTGLSEEQVVAILTIAEAVVNTNVAIEMVLGIFEPVALPQYGLFRGSKATFTNVNWLNDVVEYTHERPDKVGMYCDGEVYTPDTVAQLCKEGTFEPCDANAPNAEYWHIDIGKIKIVDGNCSIPVWLEMSKAWIEKN